MSITSRTRMIAALEGREVDVVPVAPYFWGAEYVWRLLGRPIWEVLHGPGDVGMEILEALDARHGCDWVIPLHGSSGQLAGKSYAGEDVSKVYFTDDSTSERYVFHKEGHWLVHESEVDTTRLNNEGSDIEPPQNKAEADAWLSQRCPHLASEPGPHNPNTRLRDRFPDRFLCGSVMPPFANFAYMIGFEPALVLLHDDPALCAYMIERTMAHVPARCAALAADGYDGALMCDSWASADIMSPETYSNWVAPLHGFMSDELHRVGLKSIMYNTGNILPLSQSIATLGYDAISAEERIKGVEIEIGEMRRLFGPDQCLFGNFDSYLLMNGDREAIRQAARRQLDAAGARSFVMGTGSPVCDATEPDTIDSWISEVRVYFSSRPGR